MLLYHKDFPHIPQAQLLAALPTVTLVQVYAGVIESRTIPMAKDSTSFDILENLVMQTTEAIPNHLAYLMTR